MCFPTLGDSYSLYPKIYCVTQSACVSQLSAIGLKFLFYYYITRFIYYKFGGCFLSHGRWFWLSVIVWLRHFVYSKVLSYDDWNQGCVFIIWICRLSWWNAWFSSWTWFQTPSANLFILMSMGSIFNCCCLSVMGQIIGQCSFIIHLMALFCIIWSFLICVFELMLSGTTGYVSSGSMSAL